MKPADPVAALKARQQAFEQRAATYGTLFAVLVIGGLVVATIVTTGVVWPMVLGAVLGAAKIFAPRTTR